MGVTELNVFEFLKFSQGLHINRNENFFDFLEAEKTIWY